MADNFHIYLKKQLLEYVESERKKGIPLDAIESTLLNAGHQKNIIDEVFLDLKKEEIGKEVPPKKDPIENDMVAMLKKGITQFMAQPKTEKEISGVRKEIDSGGTEKIVEEVIEEAEIIEEKTMLEGITFFIYLVGIGILTMFTAGATDSEIVKVALGFSPIIINAFISFFAVKLADNVPLYVFIPLGISSIFFALGKFAGLVFFESMEVEALSVVNFLLSFIFNILIVYVRFLKPRHMKRRLIKKEKQQKTTHHHLQQQSQQQDLNIKRRSEIEELQREFNIQH